MLIALFAVAALAGSSDPEGVIATAPTGHQSVLVGAEAPMAPDVPAISSQAITPHGLTTDQQIDQWIAQRAQGDKPFSEAVVDPWARPRDDRKMHSEYSAEIGTGDYSAYSAAVSIPVGENGRVDLSYRQSKNGYGYGYGYPGYGYPGGGYGYGDPFYSGRGWIHPGYSPSSSTSFGLGFEWRRDRSESDRDRDKTPIAED